MNVTPIRSGIAVLALLATSFTAEAADMPRSVYRPAPPPVAYYNWTGLYGGINGGYAWGKSNLFGTFDSSPSGFVIGGTLGYNYQIGSFVWGIEGDFDYANVKGDTACLGFICETRSNWLATVRGRVGYAFDRFLPYFTGGGAFSDIEVGVPLLGLNQSSNRVGWTVGGGIEYAFLSSWTAKLEYLYVDLGRFDTTFTAPFVANNVDFKANVVRVGLNYKFFGPTFTNW
jgi:outer membrane immunogenic protein